MEELERQRLENMKLRDLLWAFYNLLHSDEPMVAGGGYQFDEKSAAELNALMEAVCKTASRNRQSTRRSG